MEFHVNNQSEACREDVLAVHIKGFEFLEWFLCRIKQEVTFTLEQIGMRRTIVRMEEKD